MRRERRVHSFAGRERRQHDVRRHWHALEHVETDGIADRREHRAGSGADWRFADAARADRAFRDRGMSSASVCMPSGGTSRMVSGLL